MRFFRKAVSLLTAAVLTLTLLPIGNADIIYEYTVDNSGGGALPQQYRDLFLYKSITAEGMSTTLNYRLYVPEDYDSKKKYPVLLFLHGYGERGSDNEAQLNIGMMTNFFTKGYYKKFPAILIAAQCPGDTQWAVQGYNGSYKISDTPGKPTFNEAIQLCKRAVDKTIEDYSVDTNRLYVTGLSMGGYGTWNIITHYPDYFAGAIPICGGGDPSKASRLVNTPIWCFHGSSDPTVPCSGSGDMYKAITAAGGALIDYTVWVGVGHAWQPAYVREDVWAWLFRQNKANIDTTRLSEKIADVENADTSSLTAEEKQKVLDAVAYAKDIVNGTDHSASKLNAAGSRIAAAKELFNLNLAAKDGVTVIDCGREMYPNMAKENVNDNDPASGWQLNGGGDGDYASGVWVGYDFGKDVTFGSVGVLWEDASRADEGQYTVQISSDGQNWTDIGDARYAVGKASEGGTATDTVTFSSVTARFVRLNITGGINNKYYPKIYELTVSSAPAQEDVLFVGDTDGDGEISASDLTKLARHVGGIETITDAALLANADIDGDGEVGAADLTKLARFVGGIDKTL